mmetsp:Transcript_8090/g.34049  ORF Transcript_8090/g.34049 Transcript_8090/m.34049 type:complete len:113 (+) Transcript_8090:54-392(+)
MSGRARLVEEVLRQFSRCEVSTTRKFAGEIVDSVFAAMKADIKQEGSFALSGFGTFKTATRAARDMDVSHLPNSKDMGVIHIPESTVVRFKPAKGFKEWLNDPNATAAPIDD